MKMEAEIGGTQLRMQGATRGWRRQGKSLSWGLWREHGPADALISDLSSETATEQIYVVLNY